MAIANAWKDQNFKLSSNPLESSLQRAHLAQRILALDRIPHKHGQREHHQEYGIGQSENGRKVAPETN